MAFLPPSGGVFRLSHLGVIAGYPMQTVMRLSRFGAGFGNKKSPHNNLNLPGGSGLSILEELKKLKKRESVIIVSAKDSIEDKVTGLDLGADDYLAKPFHLAELHARVKSVIRRHQTDGNTKIEIENLTVCPDNHTVFINGEELKLNRKEFDLLYYFATNPNRLINKTTLAEAVWGDNIDQADSLDFIYSQVKNLRKKMKTAEATPEIKAVYGFGYKLITTPEA